jgi:hypothetical protein
MYLEIFPLSKVVDEKYSAIFSDKIPLEFWVKPSNFGRCYLSNLQDAADMIWYDRGRGSQNARENWLPFNIVWEKKKYNLNIKRCKKTC